MSIMVFELLFKNQLENKCNIICSSAFALKGFIALLDISLVLLVIHFYIELSNYQKFKTCAFFSYRNIKILNYILRILRS